MGEFAEMFNISKKTIRRYQEREILPIRVNKANGYRFFTEEDIQAFKIYLQGKNENNE